MRECSSVVECDLPKVEAGVRFSSLAPRRCSSVVEQFFRKEEVVGSTPTIGSINRPLVYFFSSPTTGYFDIALLT